MQPKEEEIKVRVPGSIKAGVQALAASRFTSESEITRQALIEYLSKHSPQFRETHLAPALPPAKPVSYSKRRQARQRAAGIVNKAAAGIHGKKSQPQ